MIKLTIQLEDGDLVGTKGIMNGSVMRAEENLGQLLKSDTASIVACGTRKRYFILYRKGVPMSLYLMTLLTYIISLNIIHQDCKDGRPCV